MYIEKINNRERERKRNDDKGEILKQIDSH